MKLNPNFLKPRGKYSMQPKCKITVPITRNGSNLLAQKQYERLAEGINLDIPFELVWLSPKETIVRFI